MRPSSSTSTSTSTSSPVPAAGLFSPLSGAPEVDAELSDHAVVAALLDVEAALARASADAGVLPPSAASAIAAACDPGAFDVAALGRAALAAGNPVVPLVGMLGERVGGEAEAWVHHGATSQDVLDTALVLVARRATTPLLVALDAAAGRCADLATAHRDTVQLGRTLGQAAAPTTFGLTAAGWLGGLSGAARRLDVVRRGLPLQLGGAVGTLAAFGLHGLAVSSALARELGLREPPLPWHTDRAPVRDLAGALAGVLQACGKVGLDVGLLAATGVDEVREGDAARGGSTAAPTRGGSAAAPHKHDPVDAVLLVAAARRGPGLVATLLGAGLHEHQRAAGSWHAEWEPLLDLLHLAGGAAVRAAALLDGLQVRPEAMAANLSATGGLVLGEAVTARLAPAVGRARAHQLVAEAAGRQAGGDAREGSDFRAALLASPEVVAHLGPLGVEAALDPRGWLGCAVALVDRAVAAHRTARP